MTTAPSVLTGTINERDPLAFTNGPFNFTIPQSTSAGTPIGAFGVSGYIPDEYLDGIVNGGDRSASETRT